LILGSTANAASTWESGKTNHWIAVGLTGGGAALDAISGASMNPADTAQAINATTSGTSIFYFVFHDSGTTAGENSPYRIIPDDLQSGGVAGPLGDSTGTSVWVLADSNVSRFQCETLKIVDWERSGVTFPLLAGVTEDVQGKLNSIVSELTSRTNASAFTGVSAFAIASQTTAFVTSQTNLAAFSGITDFAVDSQVSAYVVAQITGTSNVFGPASLGCFFGSARTGDTVFFSTPFGMTMTGVSMIGFMNATAGASVFYSGSGQGFPEQTGGAVLANISGSGTSLYNASGTTSIPAGSVLLFKIVNLATSGSCLYTVQIHGIKN